MGHRLDHHPTHRRDEPADSTAPEIEAAVPDKEGRSAATRREPIATISVATAAAGR